MANEPTTITFMASLPPIQSAITLDGNGDGARIKLDLPATDAGAALLLQHHGAGRVLRVTIEVQPIAQDKPKSSRRFS
jgi:hypothetical protein